MAGTTFGRRALTTLWRAEDPGARAGRWWTTDRALVESYYAKRRVYGAIPGFSIAFSSPRSTRVGAQLRRLRLPADEASLWAIDNRMSGLATRTRRMANAHNEFFLPRSVAQKGEIVRRHIGRNTGSFARRKGTWRKGKGGRFVGSGG
jgi:hypothetical protein